MGFQKVFWTKMVQRITYRRRLSYNTNSNRRKKVRTPGGKLVFQYLKKRPSVPKCPMTGVKLKGIKPSRPAERKRLSLRHKKVLRAYGGVLSHKAVREKIVRAFLIEEQKLCNLLMRDQQVGGKKESMVVKICLICRENKSF